MLGIRSTRRGVLSAASALVTGGLVVLSPALARAHFILNAPACWESQDALGSPQKNGPCAAIPNAALESPTPGTPSGIVTAVQRGQMVTVTVTATIQHPGWYRVALVEGKSATQTLTSLPDPVVPANAPTVCSPTKLVNPVWSPTQPIVADGLTTGTQTFHLALPQNATCTPADPCTLQVIMVMTDHPADDCYYHHCADITIGSTAGGSSSGGSADADASVSVDAAAHDASATVDAGRASSSSSSGAGSSSGSSGATSSSSGGAAGTSSSSSGGSGGATTSSSSSGGATTGEDGGSGASTDDNSSGGCGLAVGGGSPAAAGTAGFVVLAMARRRRRRS
jgi:hypothetical protein